MIARWFFEANPSDEAVQLHLHWNLDMAPSATLTSPPAIAGLLEHVDPVDMEVPSALAAAVLVSAKASANLRITGDKAVWREEWGTLEDVDPRPHH